MHAETLSFIKIVVDNYFKFKYIKKVIKENCKDYFG